MFEYPYMLLPGGITRPMIAVVLQGPTSQRLRRAKFIPLTLDGWVPSGQVKCW